MNIRKATEKDLKIIKDITYETIEKVYPHYYPRGAVEFFVAYHNSSNISSDIKEGRVFILEEEGTVGTVTIKENEICRLFVLPQDQRKGYGGKLIDFSEKEISKRFSKIRLDASFAAKEIYLKRGYKEVESHSIITDNGDYLCYDVMEKSASKIKAAKGELVFKEISKEVINDCVDLFIDTFTKAPWYDVYESRNQVVEFFNNFLENSCFLGYAVYIHDKIVAISIGMKKPWINGVEYYIDQFCVSYEVQGKGIGSKFIKYIEQDIEKQGLNGILLNTEKSYPAFKFYSKNGFKQIDDLVVLGR